MDEEKIKISVIMPVHDGADYLAESMDSIMSQTYRDFEFIIINDCSTDDTEEIIQSYQDRRIVYLRNEENLGVARALNRGLDIARGEYVARMDADDIARPARLEIQKNYMDSHPEVDVLATSSQSFDETGVLFEGHTSTDEEVLKLDFLFSCGIAHPTVMIRRQTLERLNLRYDHDFNKVEDYDLWCRMLDAGCVIRSIDIILLDHRLHANQVTSVYSSDMFQKLKKIHERTFDNIGIDYTEEELDNFCAYGNGMDGRPVDYREFCALLEKVLDSGVYDKNKMKRYCKGFAAFVVGDRNEPLKDRCAYLAKSPFLSLTDAWRIMSGKNKKV